MSSEAAPFSPAPLHGLALALVTVGLALGTFMQVLDINIANVSIPAIAGDLAASPNEGTWVITAFAVSNAIVLPLTGWIARRIGEVRLFVAATLAFAFVSWLCGLATNLPLLVAFRVLQGAVSGPMIPLSQSLLLANYPDERKGMALALWGMTVIVAPILGPVLGGWITDNIGWPWIFYINIPVGLASAFLVWRQLSGRETSIVRGEPIDAMGLGLLVVGVGALQVLLDKGNEFNWFDSSEIVTLAVVATVALGFFLAWELTEAHPVVDLRLFRIRNFAVAAVVLSLGYLTFFGNVVVLPLWLQTQMGYTATWAGLAAAPIGFLPLVFSPVVGRTIHRVDPRLYTSLAFLVFAGVAFWTSGFNTDIGYFQLFLPRFVQGMGVAFFFVPLTTISLSSVAPRDLASAAGLSNFLRILAGGFGTSISVTLWDHRTRVHYSQLAEHLTAANPAMLHALDRLRSLGLDGQAALAALAREVTRQAALLAVDDVFWLSAWMFLGLVALLWFARPPFRAAGGASPGDG